MITDDAVYCRKPSVKETKSVQIKELAKTEKLFIKGKSIYADNESIGFYSGEETVREEIRDLFEKIVLIARRDM